jgi:hypothetical protein
MLPEEKMLTVEDVDWYVFEQDFRTPIMPASGGTG